MRIDEPGGHIDQLLRQTRQHHVQLSQMADIKAQILLTVSMLVITFTAPHLLRDDVHGRWPALIVCASCLLTVILAAYAVMPKTRLIPTFVVPKKDQTPTEKNLLFFGDFTQLSLAEFESMMERVMNNPSKVYQAKVREVYTMGVYLAKKKYRYIQLAYTVFIAGLVISGIALVLSLMLSPDLQPPALAPAPENPPAAGR
jgi:hypothetical protein